MKAFVDKHLDRALSRKLQCMVVSSVFLCLGYLNSEQWMTVAACYLAGQSAVDAVKSWKG